MNKRGKNFMAKVYKKNKIQDTEGGGFGQYREDVGGGGSPNPSSQGYHGHGANSDYREENNDTMQPRTDDGKFTYKSANGKGIQGKSRGKTVNPVLTGGENGVYIKDVKKQFEEQSGKYWDKYKDKWYRKGDKMAIEAQGLHHKKDFTTRVSAEDIWNVAQTYNENLGEFGGGGDVIHKTKGGTPIRVKTDGTVVEGKVFDQSKKGRRTKNEQKAIDEAKRTGKEQAVIGENGGFESANKPQAKQPEQPSTPASQPQPKTKPEPTQPQVQAGKKYNSEQVGKVKDWFNNKFGKNDPEKTKQIISKLDSLTPEQLDKQIDLWQSKGVDFGLNNKSNEKTLKAMGLQSKDIN